MSYYSETVDRIRKECYPKDEIIARIVLAKNFMEINSAANPELPEISDAACMSRFHFHRLFKRIYGTTPHQHLTSVRIMKAKKQLQAGMNVVDVCISEGFESIPSFSNLFRKITGMTPGESRLFEKKQF